MGVGLCYNQLNKLEFGYLISNAPKPPLCKGRWAKSLILLGGVVNPSVSFADSSLYTREPWALLLH